MSSYLSKALLLSYNFASNAEKSGKEVNEHIKQMEADIIKFAGRRAHSLRDAHLLIGQARIAERRQQTPMSEVRVAMIGGVSTVLAVCPIHCDASVMNARGECDTCLDDAHEAEIMAR